MNHSPIVPLQTLRNGYFQVYDDNCKSPPPLLTKADVSCYGQTGLSGAKLEHPRRILHLFTMGFEIDTLEILLREEEDVVDFIFIVESMRIHFNRQNNGSRVRKPLVWDKLKFTERFNFLNLSKVIHIVVDEIDMMSGMDEEDRDSEGSDWAMEYYQNELGLARALEWIDQTDEIHDDDIFIVGHSDEVLSRDSLQQLKWCELSSPVIRGNYTPI